MNLYSILKQTQRQRVSDGQQVSLLDKCDPANRLLVLVLPHVKYAACEQKSQINASQKRLKESTSQYPSWLTN